MWITWRRCPVLGMLDDIALLAWVMNSLDQELTALRRWLERQAPQQLRAIEHLPDTPEQLQLQRHEKN